MIFIVSIIGGVVVLGMILAQPIVDAIDGLRHEMDEFNHPRT